MREVTGFTRIEKDVTPGRRTLKTIKAFQRGETVLRESPLLQADEDSDSARLLAYIKLGSLGGGARKDDIQNCMTDFELRQRNIVTADALSEQELSVYEELKESLKQDAPSVSALGTLEVASFLIRWRAISHISPTHVFQMTAQLTHSCACDVEFRILPEVNMGEIIARRVINPQTRIGKWMLADASLWWKGAFIRSAALMEAGVLTEPCRCERCEGLDRVRAFICPACEAGMVMREGKSKRWLCIHCDFSGSDKIMLGYMSSEQEFLLDDHAINAVEKKLADDLKDPAAIPQEELQPMADLIVARLSSAHYLYAMVLMEMFERGERSGGGASFSSCLAALRFLEWIGSRELGTPPQALMDELSDMAASSLRFLQQRMQGVRDLRTVFIRAVRMVVVLIEGMDRSLLSKIRSFQGAVVNLRRTCAFCRKRLPDEEEEEQEEPELPLGTEDGDVVEEICPVRCSCGELRYCDLSCQIADAPRHRYYCVSHADGFNSESMSKVFGSCYT